MLLYLLVEWMKYYQNFHRILCSVFFFLNCDGVLASIWTQEARLSAKYFISYLQFICINGSPLTRGNKSIQFQHLTYKRTIRKQEKKINVINDEVTFTISFAFCRISFVSTLISSTTTTQLIFFLLSWIMIIIQSSQDLQDLWYVTCSEWKMNIKASRKIK